jgi:hypothetical protein
MHQIWVSGNPFTRTHATSYRTNIFNFFRATPGFAEDIMLDGSLPGLVERRNLIDRVLEKPPPLPSAQRLQSPPPLHTHRDDPSNDHETQTVGRNPRKKKPNRLRVISLDDGSSTRSDEISKIDPPIQGGDPGSDDYRKRLEALRDEAGTGWLRVLNASGGLTEKAVKEAAGKA